MIGSRYLSILLSAAILIGPTTTYAQGFDFGAEDEPVEEAIEETYDDAPADTDAENGGMTFSADEVAQPKDNAERPTVAILSLPAPNVPPERRMAIESKMNEVVANIPSNIYVGSSAILQELETRGVQECSREPICLGSVGLNHNVDQLLIATVVQQPTGNQTLTIDLFDTKDKVYLKTYSEKDLASDSAVMDNIEPLIKKTLDVREQRRKDGYVENTSIVGPIIAYTTLALGVGAIAGGAVYTYFAAEGDKDLKDKIKSGSISQKDAFEANEGVKSDQTISYIFYGIAAGMIATSIVFFTIDIGGDVSSEEQASIRNLHIAPSLAPNAAGLSAGFQF